MSLVLYVSIEREKVCVVCREGGRRVRGQRRPSEESEAPPRQWSASPNSVMANTGRQS